MSNVKDTRLFAILAFGISAVETTEKFPIWDDIDKKQTNRILNEHAVWDADHKTWWLKTAIINTPNKTIEIYAIRGGLSIVWAATSILIFDQGQIVQVAKYKWPGGKAWAETHLSEVAEMVPQSLLLDSAQILS